MDSLIGFPFVLFILLCFGGAKLDAVETHTPISPPALAVVKHVDTAGVDVMMVEPVLDGSEQASDRLMKSVIAPRRWKLLVAMLAIFTVLGGWTATRG